MGEGERPKTPLKAAPASTVAITPEQVRRMEESRLRAKALRSQQQPALNPPARPSTTTTTVAGQKRPYSTISPTRSIIPAATRDARLPQSKNGLAQAQDTDIRAARKFQKFVEYKLDQMTDTKGGFMTAEDDPFNKALHTPNHEDKPADMTLKDWERQQLQKRLRTQHAGPYEPGLSVFDKREVSKKCRECGTLEIDWQWEEVLHCQICNSCKEKFPDKYSLLTKTEAREDYLLTEPELKDDQLLPHLKKPNPHKSTYHDMMLYLRYQVEEYSFSEKKWGSPEGLDEEYERRQKEGRIRKEKKFKNRLQELKKRTRVDAYKKARSGGGGGFGDTLGGGRHEHEWGGSVEDPETGVSKKVCIECGMEAEEMEL